eukprot:scaffold198603_cov16-Tisochrysis_lutea.AAC.1
MPSSYAVQEHAMAMARSREHNTAGMGESAFVQAARPVLRRAPPATTSAATTVAPSTLQVVHAQNPGSKPHDTTGADASPHAEGVACMGHKHGFQALVPLAQQQQQDPQADLCGAHQQQPKQQQQQQ